MEDSLSIIEEEMEQLSVTTGEISPGEVTLHAGNDEQ